MGETVSVAGPIFSRSQPNHGTLTVEDESIHNGGAIYSLATYHTVNGGKSWTPVPPSLPPSSTFVAGPFYLNPTIVWALSQQNLFKTANGGQTWTSPPRNGIPQLLRNYTPVAIAVSSPRLAWLIGESSASGQQSPVSHLFMTSNGGMTWNNIFK